MAWTTPPTFVDTNTLTAAQLNILSDNQEFLHGIANVPNVPFKVISAGNDINQTYKIQHRGQYLHYWVHITGGTHDELTITYNGTDVYEDLGAQTGPYTWQSSVDLNDTGIITPTPTIGTVYDLEVDFKWTSAATVYIYYLRESDQS